MPCSAISACTPSGNQVEKRNRRLRCHSRLLTGRRRRAEERHAGFFHDREDGNVVDVTVASISPQRAGTCTSSSSVVPISGRGVFRGVFSRFFSWLCMVLTLPPTAVRGLFVRIRKVQQMNQLMMIRGARNIFY